MRTGRSVLTGGLLIAVLALATGCVAGSPRVDIGKAAPPLEGPAIVEGERVDLASFRGRVALVNFWGSWCEPCRRELPLLVEAEKAGTALLGVAVEDSRRRAREMLAAYGAPWPSADDPDRRISQRWGVGGGFPVTFAVDADGVVRGRHIGEMSGDDLDGLIASARS